MSYPAAAWRETRREASRAAIVNAAWAAVEEAGLAGLSLRDLARRAGTTTPTIYKYFASKSEIHDAMFGQAAADFEACMAAPYPSGEPRDVLLAGVRRFFEFCTSDVPRYQLLFQRTIPGFVPSAASYAPAVRTLEGTRRVLERNGVTGDRELDLWTALVTGLVDQQISNDPGGDRWTRLAEDAVAMFLEHTRHKVPQRGRSRRT